MTTKQDLKTRRVEANITRKVAAEAASISQFKLDRIERGVDGIADDDRKAATEFASCVPTFFGVRFI